MKNNNFSKYNFQNLTHAYIVFGSDEAQTQFVVALQKFLDIHSTDLSVLESLEKIKIADMRALQHEINLKPLNSQYRLAIIKKADNLTLEAANAILKTLEEPPEKAIIVLLSRSEKEILPTVISRCRKIRLVGENDFTVSPELFETFTNISQMSIKEKFDLADKISKDDLEVLFGQWIIFFRKGMLGGDKFAKNMVKKIRAGQKILKTNVNKRLLIENILLDII